MNRERLCIKDTPAGGSDPINFSAVDNMAHVFPSLLLKTSRPAHLPFTQMFQQGVNIEIKPNGPIINFLNNRLGLSQQVIKKRIRTIILDGCPVDDLTSAILTDGSILALSSAMPGLAGAILQSRGALAAMRPTITHQGNKVQRETKRGIIRLKLFNLLVREIGPVILEKGILLPQKEVLALLKEHHDWFKNVLRSIHCSNHAAGWENTLNGLQKDPSNILKFHLLVES